MSARVSVGIRGLSQFLSLQRLRIKTNSEGIVARYHRRVAELGLDRPAITDRGVPQPWHRDETHIYQERE